VCTNPTKKLGLSPNKMYFYLKTSQLFSFV
jgi:hypothetical protein